MPPPALRLTTAFRHLATTPTTLPRRTSLLTSSSRYCPQCLHRMTTSVPSRRRTLQTATAYKPATLVPSQSEPPPAQNSGVPGAELGAGERPGLEASFEGNGKVRTDLSRGRVGQSPLQSQSQPPGQTPKQQESSSSASQSQHSQSSAPAPAKSQSQAQSQAQSQPPQRKRPLRPRKAAMTLTPAAVTQLRALLSAPDPKLIRIGVKNKGCSGLAYNLEYVDGAGKFDESVEQDGVRVLVDNKALFTIIGSEMDWVEDKLSRKFVFRNPNITEQCGCGESFSVS